MLTGVSDSRALLAPYRRVLRLPGMRSLVVLAVLARIPATAAGVTLTLHVVLGLGRGYGAAGWVGAAGTVGAAVGAPWVGRLVDRVGLRPVLVLCGCAEATFWGSAPWLPLPVLLITSVVGGVLSAPVFTVVRQAISVLVPAAERRPAYALDSMSVELSYMAGPALGVLVATALTTRIALLAVGVAMVASVTALWLLDPPVRASADLPVRGGSPVSDRVARWWPGLPVLLAVTMSSTLVLSGCEVSVVAGLRQAGEVSRTGLVMVVWGLASITGGCVHGVLRRAPAPAVLTGLLGLLTVPVGLAAGWWALALAVVPAGLLCAPSVTATADRMSHLAPARARGLAMGLHASAMTLGIALGAPLAGTVIDAATPFWGFVAVGGVGAVISLIALAAGRSAGGAAAGGASAGGEQPGDLDGVERGALAQVVVADEEGQAAAVRDAGVGA
jgi:MFS family permease